MALLPSPNLDLTDKDFDALRARLENLLRSAFPDWTDYNVATFGNILLELFAFVGDVLGFYQDNQSRESRITTAQQRKNLIALTKLIGFTPSGNTAAQADISLTLAAAAVADVVFEADTIIKTESVVDPIEYRFLTGGTIIAGLTGPITITAENSSPEEELFGATGIPNQEVKLARTPFLDGSAAVAASNGLYTEVADFNDSKSTDRHFVVIVDNNDQAIVRFGDGTNGALPTGTISVNYRVGGGSAGRVELGTLTKFDRTFADINGNAVTVIATNPAKSIGGVDRQNVEQIRELAPQTLRSVRTSVAREDFEINALRLPNVSRALFLTSNEDTAIPENSGILFPIPVGGGAPTQQLKDDVLTQVTVTFPSTVTFVVLVQDPLFLTVNISAVLFLKQGFTGQQVKDSVTNALTAFFALENADGTANTKVDFGFNLKDEQGNPDPELAFSDLFNEVRDAAGVRKVDDGPDGLLINGLRADVSLQLREFPMLGTVTLTNGLTGQPL